MNKILTSNNLRYVFLALAVVMTVMAVRDYDYNGIIYAILAATCWLCFTLFVIDYNNKK